MLKVLALLFCLASMAAHTQNQAYYITDNYEGADLLKVNLNQNHYGSVQAYAFGDSVCLLKDNSTKYQAIYGMNLVPFPTAKSLIAQTAKPDRIFSMSGIPTQSNELDSISVLGKWHKIYTHMDDDGFVGGRPNQVNRHIMVNNIGVIYSYSNFLNGHTLFMLCLQDTAKQRVLEAVYKHLEERNEWFSDKKIRKLSANYTFNTCLDKLKKQWLASRNHLQLMSVVAQNMNRQINYTATIKNISDQSYYLSQYASISPAIATIHYPDSTTYPSNLLDTHYGLHYKQLHETIFILPGQEISFVHSFSEYRGCGSCNLVTYDGFQIFSNTTLFQWLMSDTLTHEGKLCRLYPHREIRK